MTILHRAAAALVVVLLVATGSLVPAGAAVDGRAEDSVAGVSAGETTQLVYEDCYEHLGRFAVPTEAIDIALPDGFAYLSDAASGGVFVNVVGLDCLLGGHRVVDVFVAAPVNTPPEFTPPEARGSLLLVRRYTSRPDAAARFAQWCFGNVAHLGDVEADVVTNPDGTRTGFVSGQTGSSSIELSTSTRGERDEAPSTIQHFTVMGNQIGGRLTFSAGPGTRVVDPTFSTATLVLDGVTYAGLGAHVHPSSAGPELFDFTYSGLSCPPA